MATNHLDGKNLYFLIPDAPFSILMQGAVLCNYLYIRRGLTQLKVKG